MGRRGRNLTDADIKAIVGILDGSTTNMTWAMVIAKAERALGCRYTRQALHKHARIQDAFAAQNKGGTDTAGPKKPTEVQALADRIARLNAENQRLEMENNHLLEQFARWAYNAAIRNLDADYLNQPLPAIDRAGRKESA
jgi:uncharacterized protein (DUF2235 family)